MVDVGVVVHAFGRSELLYLIEDYRQGLVPVLAERTHPASRLRLIPDDPGDSLVKRFNRRIHPSVSAFIADLKAIMAQRNQMQPLMRGESIDTAFRERLMLAVTAVNGCSYCSYVHARQALAEGIDSGEVEALLGGVVENSPIEEVPALLYAQHWAETAGKIDPAARERIIETYDDGTVNAIELALQTIQMGNLLGNTMDYVLYRLSFGRLGVSRDVDSV